MAGNETSRRRSSSIGALSLSSIALSEMGMVDQAMEDRCLSKSDTDSHLLRGNTNQSLKSSFLPRGGTSQSLAGTIKSSISFAQSKSGLSADSDESFDGVGKGGSAGAQSLSSCSNFQSMDSHKPLWRRANSAPLSAIVESKEIMQRDIRDAESWDLEPRSPSGDGSQEEGISKDRATQWSLARGSSHHCFSAESRPAPKVHIRMACSQDQVTVNSTVDGTVGSQDQGMSKDRASERSDKGPSDQYCSAKNGPASKTYAAPACAQDEVTLHRAIAGDAEMACEMLVTDVGQCSAVVPETNPSRVTSIFRQVKEKSPSGRLQILENDLALLQSIHDEHTKQLSAVKNMYESHSNCSGPSISSSDSAGSVNLKSAMQIPSTNNTIGTCSGPSNSSSDSSGSMHLKSALQISSNTKSSGTNGKLIQFDARKLPSLATSASTNAVTLPPAP
eukprot:gnl/MRDRNA2_/MRDRNA2_26530_c0_seq1.p1 gnl/MRDRNA2_/MRDRNA2_26530_c0~~gnl/MRDRNA2_/MRDRNA2_26530_c0_seq1.p1  ORF type:complete len:488 (-),score=77.91 gnl/MRDRNA2_/MRDRNA2_26530_c0_seq1:54-1394(-)